MNVCWVLEKKISRTTLYTAIFLPNAPIREHCCNSYGKLEIGTYFFKVVAELKENYDMMEAGLWKSKAI